MLGRLAQEALERLGQMRPVAQVVINLGKLKGEDWPRRMGWSEVLDNLRHVQEANLPLNQFSHALHRGRFFLGRFCLVDQSNRGSKRLVIHLPAFGSFACRLERFFMLSSRSSISQVAQSLKCIAVSAD